MDSYIDSLFSELMELSLPEHVLEIINEIRECYKDIESDYEALLDQLPLTE